jgi:hypothetical protein
MNDIRRAIAYAASHLQISHSTAELLPGKVLADLWDQRERDRQTADQAQEDQDGTHDHDPTA